ncbi:MAG: hypothetical protein OXI38_02455 [Bacteroidota bacterium]|nr:hypothetical protein [Bacteroidota bacterium]
MSARPRIPARKQAEFGDILAQRHILAPLRKIIFHSLPVLTAALLEEVKAAPLAGRRPVLFEELDKPVLRAQPYNRYEHGAWIGRCKVALDYQVQIETHLFIVPPDKLTARYTL